MIQTPNTTTHSAPSTLFPLSPWHNTVGILRGNKSNQPALRSSRLLAPSLLTTSRLVSLALNQVCHTKLFSFSLRVFSMKWSNRLSVFSFAAFRSYTLSFDSAAHRCFCVCPLHLPEEYLVISPRPFQQRRTPFVFCGTSAPISQSQSPLISVMNVS